MKAKKDKKTGKLFIKVKKGKGIKVDEKSVKEDELNERDELKK